MKIAITGSRNFTDFEKLSEILNAMNPSCVCSGGAAGADTLGKRYAIDNGIEYQEVLPRFKTDPGTPYHARWYLKRNEEIVDMSDFVLAFWDGKSKGTKYTINYAKKKKKNLEVIHY